MVAARIKTRKTQSLADVLAGLAETHEALLESVEAKIDAMRRADTAGISRAMQAEHEVMGRIRGEEDKRRCITERLARGYGIGATAARRMNAAKLADRIGGNEAVRIREAANRLRGVTTQIARRNHVAQLISQNVLRHLKCVFVAMTGRDVAGAGYAPDGAVSVGAADRIFDAVG